MMFVGHSLTRRTFTPGKHPDARPPFLFLRAFDDDDRRSVQPNTWLAWLYGIEPDFGKRRNRRSAVLLGYNFHPVRWFTMLLGTPSDTLEELLANGVQKAGPLVAIGEPNERSATSGADRMYVSDDQWRNVVQSYLTLSAGVILQPSLTDGVLWEIERTLAMVPRNRILFSMVNFQGRQNDYERLWFLLHEKYQLKLPRIVPNKDRPCFVVLSSDGKAHL